MSSFDLKLFCFNYFRYSIAEKATLMKSNRETKKKHSVLAKKLLQKTDLLFLTQVI